MEFAFKLDYQTALEVVGLTLAMLGFFNLSAHLERAFGALQASVWGFAKWNIKRRNELWPPHKNWRVLILQSLMRWPMSGAIIVIVVLWMDWWEPLQALWLGLDTWQQVAFGVSAFLLFIPYELTIVFGNATLLAGIFYLLNRLFWMLGLPPSGVTGSLGLILTLVTFFIGRIGLPSV